MSRCCLWFVLFVAVVAPAARARAQTAPPAPPPTAVAAAPAAPAEEGVPLRFASGYLTSNGPVARLATGLAIAVGKKVDLIPVLGSMVWITNNQNLLSLDLALEVAFRL